MPIYKFKCKPCKLDDVKKFLYRFNKKTGAIDLRVCEECGTPVDRVWGNPPDSWYRSIQGRQNNE
jgi:predicted nucleic acid-binding Zn ribbon protein